MKNKALISSIVAIILCLTLIVGSTYALFTHSDDVTVNVDAGHVEVGANLSDLVLYSAEPDADGEEFDEYGKPYTYVKRDDHFFYNRGTATLDSVNGVIELTNITPGDKITFKLKGTNASDVAIQYRYKIECLEGYKLMSGCVCTVGSASVPAVKYASMASYYSAWTTLPITATTMEDVDIALELPVSAGNEFQDQNAKIRISIEAVQSNADISDTDAIAVKYITSVENSTELAAKINSDEYLHIFLDNDIDDMVQITTDLSDKTIDANGHNVQLVFGDGTNPIALDNVILKSIIDTVDDIAPVVINNGVSGDLTVIDSDFYGDGAAAPAALFDATDSASELDLTFDRCDFFADGSANAIYFVNVRNLTIRNSTFNDTASFAVMSNGGTASGNVVISDSVFNNCAGILSCSVAGGTGTGSLSGNLTFANNKMYGCTLNGGNYIASQVLRTLTFSNNTMEDIIVTPEDMKGIVVTTTP